MNIKKLFALTAAIVTTSLTSMRAQSADVKRFWVVDNDDLKTLADYDIIKPSSIPDTNNKNTKFELFLTDDQYEKFIDKFEYNEDTKITSPFIENIILEKEYKKLEALRDAVDALQTIAEDTRKLDSNALKGAEIIVTEYKDHVDLFTQNPNHESKVLVDIATEYLGEYKGSGKSFSNKELENLNKIKTKLGF